MYFFSIIFVYSLYNAFAAKAHKNIYSMELTILTQSNNKFR